MPSTQHQATALRPPARPASPQATASRQQRTPLLVMTVLALWLAAHPWRGFWHDSLLYTVQALRRLYPASFQNELYFLYGSQDAFTVFSPLYAAVIQLAGLEPAAILLQLAGYALWAGAAVFLLRAALQGLPFWLALAILSVWPSDYGPTPGVFRLAEPFLTPRLFAEGLGLLGLGCFLRQRWGWGMLAAGLAIGLHPLVACGPLLTGVLFRAWGNWRALGAACAAGAVILAAGVASGIPPFDRLAMSMDDEWLGLVNQRAPMVSWSTWQASEWVSRTALAFALVLAGARLADGPLARLFRCAAVAGALGLLGSFLASVLDNNLLLLQAQPWRTLWVTQLCSWLALAWLLGRFWSRGRVMRALLAALLLAALTRNTVGGAVAILAAAGLCYCAPKPELRWPSWGKRAALAGSVLLLLAWLLEVSFATAKGAPLLPDSGPRWVALLWGTNLILMGLGPVCGTLLLLAVWRRAGSRRKGRHLGAFALAFGSLCVAAVFAAWPGQGRHDLSPEGERAVLATFAPLIPTSAVMYWQNNVQVSWFKLRRSNYASNIQLTGLAFNRGTAMEGWRRMARLQRLGGEDAVLEPNGMTARLSARFLPAAGLAGLRYVCADPILDFVVLGLPLQPAVIAQARDERLGKTYYLHDCARLRAAAPSPGGRP